MSKDSKVHHKLIYGVAIKKTKLGQIVPKLPFQCYTLPKNGKNDGADFVIMGLEYGRIYGVYDGLHEVFGCGKSKLQFNKYDVPDEIVSLFKKTYPNHKAGKYAIIQNVRSYDQDAGIIMYGYWVTIGNDNYDSSDSSDDDNSNKKNKTDYKSDSSDDDDDIELKVDNSIDSFNNTSKDNLWLQKTFCRNIPYPGTYFYGKRLGDLTMLISANDCKLLEEQLSQVYEHDLNIPSRMTMIKNIKKISSQLTLYRLSFVTMIKTSCSCCD
jgi:hypothetical protein